MRLVLIVAMLAGCWSEPKLAVVSPAIVSPPEPLEECRDAGDVLHVAACNRGHVLQWWVTNRTERALWCFLRMPSMRDGSLADENVFVAGTDGHLSVVKATAQPRSEEQPFGVVELSPGEEVHGSVVLGRRIDGSTDHIAVMPTARGPIRDVVFAVGYAEQRTTDQPRTVNGGLAFYGFDPDRQVVVTTPPIPW